MRVWVVLVVAVSGCYGDGVTHCPTVDCPANLVCDNHDGCALVEQIERCAGQPNGASCSYPGVDTGECVDQLCVPPGCGNGILTSDEACDDGNNISGDGCSADCKSRETCGNGIVDPAAGEQCDGTPNCRLDCTERRCGDGILDPAFEACDDGNANSDTEPDACRTNCQRHRCGDGVQDTGEACDDGNNVSGDDCSADCLSTEICGDGILNIGTESCDCGSAATAAPANCGGFQNDDNNPNAPCREDCTLRRCNDGILEAPEQCEPSLPLPLTCQDVGFYGDKVDGGLACSQFCTFDTSGCTGKCGDGVRNGPEQCDGPDLNNKHCDDVGFYGDKVGTTGLACNSVCSFDTSNCTGQCGDGVKDALEQCDGPDHNGRSCTDFGFYGGTLLCNGNCGFDTHLCSGKCGDNVINDSSEGCDNFDFGTQDCTTFGFYEGTLVCSGGCKVLFVGCDGFCGDGEVSGPEVCDRTEFTSVFPAGTTCHSVDPSLIGGVALLECSGCNAIDTGKCARIRDGKCDTPLGENCGNSFDDCKDDCVCGDGFCNLEINEDHTSCPVDCFCGNGTCEKDESTATCVVDCFCGNGTCDEGETKVSCPADCK